MVDGGKHTRDGMPTRDEKHTRDERRAEPGVASPARGVPPARDVDHRTLLERLRGLRHRPRRESAKRKRFPRTRKVLKWIFGILGSILLLVLLAVVVVWSFPEIVLTQKRVNAMAKAYVVPTQPLPAGTLPLSLHVGKPNWRTRAFQVSLAPGCYRLGGQGARSEGCFDTARIEVAIRLNLDPIAQLAWIGPIELRSSRVTILPSTQKKEVKKEEPSKPFDPSAYLKYIAKDFHWNPVEILLSDIRVPESGITAHAEVKNMSLSQRFDSVELVAQATGLSKDGSRWKAGLDGLAKREGELIRLPKVDATYHFGKTKASRIKADLAATFDTSKTTIAGKLNADWTAPFSQARSLKIRDGDFFASKEEIRTKSTVALVLAGVTHFGKPPVMSLRVSASRLQKTPDRMDIQLSVDEYSFAGLDLDGDAAFTLNTAPKADRIEWKRGGLRIGTDHFKKTVRAFRRTPWAVPAPFAVLDGPIWLKTGDIKNEKGSLLVPLSLTSNLTSREQAVALKSDVSFRLDSKRLTPKDLGVGVKIDKLRIRLPDYDPLSPVPVVVRDPRIVSKEQLEKERREIAAGAARERADAVRLSRSSRARPKAVSSEGPPAKPASIPTKISIQAGPSSVQLLNRYFVPEMDGEIDVSMDSTKADGAMVGVVQTSHSFVIHYLNRDITVDGIAITMHPEVQVEAQFSMDRSGYHVIANFTQQAGRSRIDLTSEPLLSEDEIVSLMLYGEPRSSVTADQDQSVGSAQAAMSSQALGIFSLWAFASTPIEAVLYDPATKTYSAVVRLPGGVTASIGNSWDDERQVALSKSLGKHWAISTELIEDVNGVNRGGTMLRWRKRY